MIRCNILFNLIIIGLLLPATSVALPIKITVLNVKTGKCNNELIIIHDAPVDTRNQDEKQPKWDSDAYLQAWDNIILKHRHHFMWYCEGQFDSFLGNTISNFSPRSSSSEIFFMERPVDLLGKVSSAFAVDVRVFSNLYSRACGPLDQTLPYLNVEELRTVLTYLKEAQQSINKYGSDTAKRHAKAIIELTQLTAKLPSETKIANINSLAMLHIAGHFDVVTLGSILYALANYSQPCVLICGAIHADNLIELLCANQKATIIREVTSTACNSINIDSIITTLDRIDHKANISGLQKCIDNLTNLNYRTNPSGDDEEEAQKQLLLQELFLLRENNVAHQHLPDFVRLSDIEKAFTEVTARNPIQDSALRSRP